MSAASAAALASPTPLVRKLGITTGSRVLLENAPPDFGETLGELPAGACTGPRLRGGVDLVVLFVTTEERLRARFAALAGRVHSAGGIWVAWPKRLSRLPTELGFAGVQAVGLEGGLVDNKSCSIDADWQALRFVVRLRDRRPVNPTAADRLQGGTQSRR